MTENDPQKIPPDPIYAKSYSWPIALASIALVGSLALAMADEFWWRRPYKAYQQEFAEKYEAYIERLGAERKSVEDLFPTLDEYAQLNQAVEDAAAASKDAEVDLNRQIADLSRRIRSLNDALKPHNSKIQALTYSAEYAVHSKAAHGGHEAHPAGQPEPVKASPDAKPYLDEVDQVLAHEITYSWDEKVPDGDGFETRSETGTVGELRQAVGDMRTQKGDLQTRLGEVGAERSARQRDLEAWVSRNRANIVRYTATLAEQDGDSDEVKKAKQEQRTAFAKKVVEVGAAKYLDRYTTKLPASSVAGLTQVAEAARAPFDLPVLGGDIKNHEIYMAKVAQWVDRCEVCHMGIRSDVPINAEDVPGDPGHERLFVSHPNAELIAKHPFEDFGCSLCHNGNGIAITTTELAHGNNKYWLNKLHPRENFQAGCVRCHDDDWQLAEGERINAGRNDYLRFGCWGCHERAGFDVEESAARTAQKRIDEITGLIDDKRQLQENLRATLDPVYDVADMDDSPVRTEDVDAVQANVNKRIASVTQEIASLTEEQRQTALHLQSLQKQRKKAGPNLREVRKKVPAGFVTQWIENPYAWRPTTRMPRFRWSDYFDGADAQHAVRSVAAFIWQSADDPAVDPIAKQPRGDAAKGKTNFETFGCMACHSMGEGADRIGGDFAANLTYVGDKSNYDYLVAWILDPRKHNVHTVMPNLRLSEQEARDVAEYLVSKGSRPGYTPDDATWLTDESMAKEGERWVRHFGCAGCHEIKGFENEGRIGVKLTTEGSKPHDQLDFGHFTAQAHRGTYDPLADYATADGVKLFEESAKEYGPEWYGHRGFFMRKLASPGVWDWGKERPDTVDRLRMPQFAGLTAQQIHDLTSFLLGSVDPVQTPENIKFHPDERGLAIQEGWKVVKRYNCQGCHQIEAGAVPTIQTIAHFKPGEPHFKDLPPSLFNTGFRTDPEWLGAFLQDPSLGGGRANPKSARPYLSVRMPTFELSDAEVDTLVHFFDAIGDQPFVYRKPAYVPLTPAEEKVAVAIFTETNCTQCHVVAGKPMTSETKAPNLTLADSRLRPEYMRRWIQAPALLTPGTAMPEFFVPGPDGETWRRTSTDPVITSHQGDQIDLMVRYLRSLGRK